MSNKLRDVKTVFVITRKSQGLPKYLVHFRKDYNNELRIRNIKWDFNLNYAKCFIHKPVFDLPIGSKIIEVPVVKSYYISDENELWIEYGAGKYCWYYDSLEEAKEARKDKLRGDIEKLVNQINFKRNQFESVDHLEEE
jgi:hypothetical protein